MPNNFVLMSAMPPHTGHMDLIHFARNLGGLTVVLVHTQDGEPYIHERVSSIREHWRQCGDVKVLDLLGYNLAPQPRTEPEWNHWRRVYEHIGFAPGDRVVASELYGVRLAEAVGGVFVPYDLDRTINSIRATAIRAVGSGFDLWPDIIPEFRAELMVSVTIFGAESVGKTTLTRDASHGELFVTITPEWARPYLETVGAEVTEQKMRTIIEAQAAMERVVRGQAETPVLILDTDTHSTVGYWEMWSGGKQDSQMQPRFDSDLYVIPRATIPFEPDPLRYGGDKRETPDEYWIEYCERYGLDYIVLDHHDRWVRRDIVQGNITEIWRRKTAGMSYVRPDN